MTAYETRVVDGSIDDAWRAFQVRFADWLDAAPVGAEVVVDPDAGNESAPIVTIGRDEDRLWVDVDSDVADVMADGFRLAPDRAACLHELGVRIVNARPILGVGTDEVDRAVHVLVTVLRDAWGVIHPSFLSFDGADQSDLLAPGHGDVAPAAVLPELLRPPTTEALQQVVERVMSEGLEAPLRVGPEGEMEVVTPDGGRAAVKVRTAQVVEVWTVLATEVRRKPARRRIDRLATRYPTHRFFLDRDALVAATTVLGDPFVPELLQVAVGSTLHLSAHLASELDEDLKRRRHSVAPSEATDPDLVALAGSVRAVPHEELVVVIGETAGSRRRLAAWLDQAHRARRRERTLAKTLPDGAMKAVHLREWRRWHRMADLVEDALAQHASDPAQED